MNSILEIFRQVIANLVCKFSLENNDLDKDDLWSGIIADMYFSLHST